MTQLQKALPCPFCGKQHTLQVISGQELMGEDQEFWQHSESFGVVCDASTPDGKGGCGAMGGFKPTEDEAIEAWNTRTALAQQELPQKERPDFMAGYDAGMADAKRMAQQGEQQGWKRVPVEPTPEMLKAPPNAWEADAKITYAAMLAAAPAPQAQDGRYIIAGSVWFRKSTNEWVLELSGSINDTSFVSRHTQPAEILPENVPSLSTLYVPAPQPAQEPACPECGASLLYECVAYSYANYPKKQDMKPVAQDKSNNYLNGYCTGRTDLLKEQAAPQPAQGGPTGCACRWDADDNRVATCARHQGWLDVVGEWCERAKAAEAALQSAQPEDGCAPNHMCNGHRVHIPTGECCNKCGATSW